MKVLLDSKALFFMEMLKNFSFVKVTLLTEEAKTLKGFREAVEEVKLAKQGKLKTTSLNDFLDGLPN